LQVDPLQLQFNLLFTLKEWTHFIFLSFEDTEEQRFTFRSALLTSTSSRRRDAISGRPLPERADFRPAVADLQTTYAPAIRTKAFTKFTLQCSPATTELF